MLGSHPRCALRPSPPPAARAPGSPRGRGDSVAGPPGTRARTLRSPRTCRLADPGAPYEGRTHREGGGTMASTMAGGRDGRAGRRLGVGIVGISWVAGEHIKAYQQNPHCEVVALASHSRENAEAAREAHGLAEA